jgi:metal-responsive CopG/Arc/MetJ family transcriptional regulator
MRIPSQTRANFNVPEHLWERFEEVAKAHYRSRSEHLRFLMAEAVKQHDEANKGVGRGV